MYHRVAPEAASEALREYCVTPQAFEEQLQYLAGANFRSVDFEEWRRAMASKTPLPGRAVMFTFDDGYQDFADYAWPLLKRYGFTAEVFLVADRIGKTNDWDARHGDPVLLLDWEEIRRLQAEGVRFGSHTMSHPVLTTLCPAEVIYEAARSRLILEDGLGMPVTSVAYPYGSTDEAVEHLFGACGYIFGASCVPHLSSVGDRLLSLPRIEVFGSDRREQFISKLGI